MNTEVAVKTLIGKGHQFFIKELSLDVESEVSKALGCWMINHQYETYNIGRELHIKGSYDVEIWLAINDDQKSEVKHERVEFDEVINSAYKNLNTLDDKLYLKTMVRHYPTCSKLELKEGKLNIVIESEYLVDIFAEAILVVVCAEKSKGDLSLDEEILLSVNPEYLKLGNKKN